MQRFPEMPLHRALIGVTWVATQATLEVESPARGEAIGRIARCQAEEVDEAVEAAHLAFTGKLGDWAGWSARGLSEWLLAFAAVIEADHARLSPWSAQTPASR